MKVFEVFIKKNNLDKKIIESYRKMRETLQIFDIKEWQLEKGHRIPGAIYTMRAETISELESLKKKLMDYGILREDEEGDFKKYFLEKLKEIDEEIPLQKDKPDYLDDEEDL